MEARRITELSVEELAEVERLEQELDQFVEKRAQQAKDAVVVEEAWAESERKVRDKRRRANGWGWVRHYQGVARVHHNLAVLNEDKATRALALLEEPGEVA